jgi:hypothetical protein
MYLRERILKRLPRPVKRTLNIPNPNAAQQLIESAVYDYDPARYGGEALLLLASGRVSHETALAGWRSLIPFTLRTHYINAYHRELMESPNVEQIARAIVHHLPPGNDNSARPSFGGDSDSCSGHSGVTGCPQGVATNLDVALQQDDAA